MKNGSLGIILMVICLFASCVSSDKYKELVQVKEYLEQENKRLTEQQSENANLRAENRQQLVELKKAQEAVAELETSFNSLNRNYQDLANRYNALIADNRQISSGSANEKQYWEEELAKKQLELENTQREVQTLRYTLSQKEKRVQELLQLLRGQGGN